MDNSTYTAYLGRSAKNGLISFFGERKDKRIWVNCIADSSRFDLLAKDIARYAKDRYAKDIARYAKHPHIKIESPPPLYSSEDLMAKLPTSRRNSNVTAHLLSRYSESLTDEELRKLENLTF